MLGFECHRGLESFGITEAFSLDRIAVVCFDLVQSPDIQCVHRARLDADGLLALFQSFQTEVTFLHLGVLFRAELRYIPGAGIEAECVTFNVARALGFIYHHDAVVLSFSDGIYWAS